MTVIKRSGKPSKPVPISQVDIDKDVNELYNRTKGMLAETIVEDLLSELGYYVFRFGYESLIRGIDFAPFDHEVMKTDEHWKVRNMPDFLFIDPRDRFLSFVEVKFRNRGRITKNEIKHIKKNWKGTYLVVVSLTDIPIKVMRVGYDDDFEDFFEYFCSGTQVGIKDKWVAQGEYLREKVERVLKKHFEY